MSMSNFVGEGNIGKMELRTVPLSDGESKPVLNLSVRVNVDRPVQGENGQRSWEDRGGRWFLVEYWGKRAQMAEAVLQVGARVVFGGELSQEQFPSRQDPSQSVQVDKIRADFIAIAPICVDSVQYRSKRTKAAQITPDTPQGTEQSPAPESSDDDSSEDDIPF